MLYVIVHLFVQDPTGAEQVIRLSNRDYWTHPADKPGQAVYMPLLVDLDDWRISEKGYKRVDGALVEGGVLTAEKLVIEVKNGKADQWPLDPYLEAGWSWKDGRAEILWAESPGGADARPSIDEFQLLFPGTLARRPTGGDVAKLEILPTLAAVDKDFKAPKFEGAGGAVRTAVTVDERVEIPAADVPALGTEWTMQMRLEGTPQSNGRLMRMGFSGSGPLRLRVVDQDGDSWRFSVVARGSSGTEHDLSTDVVTSADGPFWLTFVSNATATEVWRGTTLVSTGAPIGEALKDVDDAMVIGSGTASRRVDWSALRVFSRALGADEVKPSLTPIDVLRWEGDLQLSLEFNDRAGDVVTDESGNGRDGQVLGWSDPDDAWITTATGEPDQHGNLQPVCLGRCLGVPPTIVDRLFDRWMVSPSPAMVRHLTYQGVFYSENKKESGLFNFGPRTVHFQGATGASLDWVAAGQTLSFVGDVDSSNDGSYIVERQVPSHDAYAWPAPVKVRMTESFPFADRIIAGTLESSTPFWSQNGQGLTIPPKDGAPVFLEVIGEGGDVKAAAVTTRVLESYSELAGQLPAMAPGFLPAWVGTFVSEPQKVRDVLDPVLIGARAWLRENADGTLAIEKSDEESLTAQTPRVITSDEIVAVEPVDAPEVIDGVRAGYAQTWAPQDEGALLEAASAGAKAQLSAEFRWAEWPIDATGKIVEVRTALQRHKDAEAVARQVYEHSADGRLFRIRMHLPLDDQLDVYVGRVVQPTWPRHFDNSPVAVVLAVDREPFKRLPRSRQRLPGAANLIVLVE